MKRARSTFVDGRPFVLLGLTRLEARQLQAGNAVRIEAATVAGADVLLAFAPSETDMAAHLARGEQSLPEPAARD